MERRGGRDLGARKETHKEGEEGRTRRGPDPGGDSLELRAIVGRWGAGEVRQQGAAPGCVRPPEKQATAESHGGSPTEAVSSLPTSLARLDFPGRAGKGKGREALQGHYSAAEPALWSRLPCASVQQADIDPAQPSSIAAACSPLCSGPTKKRWGLAPPPAPAGMLRQNKSPRAQPKRATSPTSVPWRPY